MDIPSEEENDSDKNNNRTSKDLSSGADTLKDPKTGTNQTYDPHQRNPLYSGAENSCSWELNRLSRHYHPSVCLFASTLMKVSFVKGSKS